MQRETPLFLEHAAECPPADPLLDLGPEDDLPASAHSGRQRLLALALAGILLAMTLLAAGYSLFGPPPTPERTRPLPEHIPHQGAIR